MISVRYVTLFFTRTYLRQRLFARATAGTFLSALGTQWLFLRMGTYFSSSVSDYVLKHGALTFWGMLAFGALATVLLRRPRLKIVEKMSERDIVIRIVVDDILRMKGPTVIGTNTTFDTDAGMISSSSIQGQFTDQFYHSVAHLDSDLDCRLPEQFVDLSHEGGRKGKNRRYPLGTVVTLLPKGQRFYWLAIADMNQHGSAECEFSMVSDALNCLWEHLGTAGDHEKELFLPALGTGAGRLPQSRETVIREIISSFIAASTQKQVCDRLSIVVHPDDFHQFFVDMEGLQHYLSAQCRYWKIPQGVGAGSAEP